MDDGQYYLEGTTPPRRPRKPVRLGRDKLPADQRPTRFAWKGKKDRHQAKRTRPPDVPHADPIETHFRHGHWHVRRQRIREHLATSGSKARQLEQWDNCGAACTVQYSDTEQRFRLAASYCKSRHCEPCMRAKANLIARNLREKLEERRASRAAGSRNPCRFITLTLKHNTAPLAEQWKRLKAAFKSLRKTELWKRSQVGGAMIPEVKHTGRAWHPHLHIISEGTYLGKEELSRAWHECTGDSFIVDIRAIDRDEDACHYVCKYVTKAASGSVWQTDDTAQEWITASRGMRCCDTFGSWRGMALTKPTSTVTDWRPLCTLAELVAKARSGDLAAQAIMLQLRPPGVTEELHATEHDPP